MTFRAILIGFLMALPTLSSAEERPDWMPRPGADTYIGLLLGTAHVGCDCLNDRTPGLTYGMRWGSGISSLEYHMEGGVFYNSYEEVAPLFLTGASIKLATFGRLEVRGGASIGTAYYGTLAPQLEEKFSIPNAAGFVPMAAATLSVRHQRSADQAVDYRFTMVPGDDVDAIINFSVAFSY